MHIDSTATYLKVFGALFVLTIVTYVVALYDWGIWSTPIALAIALVKASLVVMIFMNVRNSSRLIKLFVGSALLWLVFLFSFPLADQLTRSFFGVEGK
jgi:cytochrome c oxidase subunit 4